VAGIGAPALNPDAVVLEAVARAVKVAQLLGVAVDVAPGAVSAYSDWEFDYLCDLQGGHGFLQVQRRGDRGATRSLHHKSQYFSTRLQFRHGRGSVSAMNTTTRKPKLTPWQRHLAEAQKNKAKVCKLADAGKKPLEIAKITGYTHQRIYQILAELNAQKANAE
jgi:hypothetical protein